MQKNNNSDEWKREIWFEEIIRETEHFFQGEIQQEQRASWILASVCVLLAIIIGLQVQSDAAPNIFLVLAEIFFFVSGLISVITIVPLRGTSLRNDLWGKSFRKARKMNLEEIIQSKFHPGTDWSDEKYLERIYYHFRSHYLRARLKGLGVIWASISLIVGFCLLIIYGVCQIV
jgi:hypothetical protein